MELILNNDNFEQDVLKNEKPVLVDFWAPWCGPCRMLAPHVEKMAEEYAGRLVVGKVNADECPELCIGYRIVSIPALYLFENGEIVARSIGYLEEDELRSFIAKSL